MIVSIPSSISFAVSLISPFEASIRIHSRIDIVVLLGTALETVLTPFKRLDFEHMIFMCITPFAVFHAGNDFDCFLVMAELPLQKYINYIKFVVFIIRAVEM